MEVDLGPGDFVLDGDPAPPHPKGHSPPIFGPYPLRPKGFIDQDATWYGGRPRPRRLCVRWGPRSLLPKKGRSPPMFGPRILWPNVQDANWYGGRHRPSRHCVRWGPSCPSPKGVHSLQFSANVRCGQTAGWTKMSLGMEVGLGPGDFVFDGDPATAREKAYPPPPIFGPCLLWANGWMDQDATWYGGKRRPRRRCARWGGSSS